MLLGIGLPGVASEPEIVSPEVAGTTVIQASGIVGITMMLPEPVRILQDNLTIDADESPYQGEGTRTLLRVSWPTRSSGLWGRWLEARMTCNSWDFHDCTKPPPTPL